MAENGKSPKKPIYKRIWFWLLPYLPLLVIS